jgi:hypothetical protein
VALNETALLPKDTMHQTVAAGMTLGQRAQMGSLANGHSRMSGLFWKLNRRFKEHFFYASSSQDGAWNAVVTLRHAPAYASRQGSGARQSLSSRPLCDSRAPQASWVRIDKRLCWLSPSRSGRERMQLVRGSGPTVRKRCADRRYRHRSAAPNCEGRSRSLQPERMKLDALQDGACLP